VIMELESEVFAADFIVEYWEVNLSYDYRANRHYTIEDIIFITEDC